MIVLLILLIITFVSGDSSKNCFLLDKCRFEITFTYSPYLEPINVTDFVCKAKQSKDQFEIIKLQNPLNECGLSSDEFYIKIKDCVVLDESISSVFETFRFVKDTFPEVTIMNIKKINLQLPLKLPLNWPKFKSYGFRLIIFNSNIAYYNNNSKSSQVCDNLLSAISFIDWNAKFDEYKNKTVVLEFKNVQFTKPVCELVFRNNPISDLNYGQISESFFKTTVPRFSAQSKILKLNSSIKNLKILAYDIDLDSRLLNTKIFEKLQIIVISGQIRFIQNDLFVAFKHINFISMFYTSYTNLIKRQGMEWIKNINSDVSVDLSNRTAYENYTSKSNQQVIRFNLNIAQQTSLYGKYKIFPDEDFCIYQEYPFYRLILIQFPTADLMTNLSCLTFWLLRYHQIFKQHFVYQAQFLESIDFKQSEKCNFTRQLSKCQKIEKPTQKILSKPFQSLGFLVMSEFLIILLSPIVSFVGIILNALIISVLCKKKLTKITHYSYMIIVSACNIMVCFFQIISLINQCQEPYGLFCSTIRKMVSIQYSKLVFGQFFLYFFICMSNCSYIIFAICRLSLISNNTGTSLSKKISDLNIIGVIVAFVIFSTLLTLVKPFIFDVVDFYSIFDYEIITFPRLFYINVNYGQSFMTKYKKIFKAKLVLDIVYDFFNFCVFVFVNITIDLVLLKRVRDVLKEKAEKMNQQIQSVQDKIKQDNDNSFRELLKFVILNSLVNIFLKIPSCVTSLNDFRIIFFEFNFLYYINFSFQINPFAFPYTFGYLCGLAKVCETFKMFGHLLYLVSLSTNFFFLKRFDKNFQQSLEKISTKNKDKNSQNF